MVPQHSPQREAIITETFTQTLNKYAFHVALTSPFCLIADINLNLILTLKSNLDLNLTSNLPRTPCVYQLWVAMGNRSHTGDREFDSRSEINAAAILVFINSTIMVLFYMWILQVSAFLARIPHVPGISLFEEVEKLAGRSFDRSIVRSAVRSLLYRPTWLRLLSCLRYRHIPVYIYRLWGSALFVCT